MFVCFITLPPCRHAGPILCPLNNSSLGCDEKCVSIRVIGVCVVISGMCGFILKLNVVGAAHGASLSL